MSDDLVAQLRIQADYVLSHDNIEGYERAEETLEWKAADRIQKLEGALWKVSDMTSDLVTEITLALEEKS